MTMQTFNDAPGSEAWHARRARCFNAGDAAAMMGCSPLQTRTELLHQVHTGIAREFSDYVQKRVIDPGHRVEELCRPIAEDIIGEDLTVLAASLAVAGLTRPLGASLDGTVFMMDTNWECKSLNDEIRAALPNEGRDSADHNDGAALPLMYRVQMSQQAAVNGAKRCLFSAAKFDDEGNVTEERHAWFTVEPALCADIIAGWKQFDADLAAYVPPAAAEPAPIGRTPETLPALHIAVTGAVTASNLDAYREHALAVFAGINRELTTDQQFADAEKTVKWCGDVESRLKASKEHALSQTASIDALFKTIDDITAEARRVRLDLERLVEARKKQVRIDIVQEGIDGLRAHIDGLNKRLGAVFLSGVSVDFGAAIKGKKNLDSMRDAVQTLLAQAKVASSATADRIDTNLKTIRARPEMEFLFPDLAVLVLKAADDLAAVVSNRIATHEAAEAKKKADAEAATQLRIKEAADAAAAKATADAAALAQKQAADAAEEARADERRRVEQRDADLRSPDPAVRRDAQATMKHPNGAPMYGTSIKETGDFILLTDDGKRSVFCDLNDDPEPEAQPIRTGGGIARHAAPPASAPAVLQMPARAAAPAPAAPMTQPTLTIGAINDRLNGPKVDGAFLSALGFTPTVAKASRLYHEAQFSQICAALVAHIEAVQAQQAA